MYGRLSDFDLMLFLYFSIKGSGALLKIRLEIPMKTIFEGVLFIYALKILS